MSKKSLQQLPTHSRHISKDLPYLGYNKLPQIRNVSGVTASYVHKNHVIVKTTCQHKNVYKFSKKKGAMAEETVKCAKGELPLRSRTYTKYESIYNSLIEKWISYQRDNDCLSNCVKRTTRTKELNLRLLDLKRRVDKVNIKSKKEARNTRISLQQEATERIDTKGDLKTLKKSIQKQVKKKSIQLDEKNKNKVFNKNPEVADGLYTKPCKSVSFQKPPKDRKHSIPGENADDRHLRKMYGVVHRPMKQQKAGKIYSVHDIKPHPMQSDMSSPAAREAMKKLTERKIRRPSWLPKPNENDKALISSKNAARDLEEMDNPNPSAARKPEKHTAPDAVLHKMRDYFSENTKKAFRAVFQFFDTDANGKITTEEMFDTLKLMNFDLTMEDAQTLITTLDTRGDNVVGFNDWINYWKDMDHFADYLVPPTVENGKYHRKFTTILYSALGEIIQKEALARGVCRELKAFYAKRFNEAIHKHPELSTFEVDKFHTSKRLYGPSGGELRDRVEQLKEKKGFYDADIFTKRKSSITPKAIKELLNPRAPRGANPKYSEESGQTHLYSGTKDYWEQVEKRHNHEMEFSHKYGTQMPKSLMTGQAEEELRLGRLNRRKKLVIVFRPFAKKKKMIEKKFMPFIMPWEKDEMNMKVAWKPRKSFEELSPTSSLDVRRSYADVVKIKKDGTRVRLKKKVPKAELDHNAWLFYQRYVSVSSRHYSYDFVLDLPPKFTRWPLNKLMKLRDYLMVALKRFNRSVASKKKRNLVAHFCEMHISNLLSKKMYKRWMETYCALSSCEQGNDSNITVDWLKRSANCLRFRLKCAESAFYMRK